MAEPEVPPVGGDLRGALGPARAALGGRRRGQYAVLRAPRALQFVPAPRAVHPARAEHGVHPGAGRTPLPVLLRAVPLDLRAGKVAVRGSQERGRSDRRRRGARQAHRPAQVDGAPSSRRDRQGPAPRPRPVAPGPRSDGLRTRAMRVYLFGFASDDFLGRVIVTPDERTVVQLAGQLVSWGLAPDRGGSLTVRNEAGDILDPAATIAEAGLGNGDIFKVERG